MFALLIFKYVLKVHKFLEAIDIDSISWNQNQILRKLQF